MSKHLKLLIQNRIKSVHGEKFLHIFQILIFLFVEYM